MKNFPVIVLVGTVTSFFAGGLRAEPASDGKEHSKLPGPVLHYNFESQTVDAVLNQLGRAHPGKPNRAFFTKSLSGDTSFSARKEPVKTGYIETADHEDFNGPEFTVAAWVKLRRDDSNGSVVCKHDWLNGGARGFVLRFYSSKKPNLTIGAAGWKSVDGETPLLVNQWTHVAGTFDGTHLRIFHNGRLDGSNEITEDYTPSPYPLRVGHAAFALDRHRKFDGQLDDVMLWNRALSESELRELYEEQKDARPKPLTPESIAPLVKGLGADDYQQRVATQQRLIELDTELLPLIEGHQKKADPEIAWRLRQVKKIINRDLSE